MKYCCFGRIHRVCCLIVEYPRLFRRREFLFLKVCFFCIFFFVWMLSRSILHCAVRGIFRVLLL